MQGKDQEKQTLRHKRLLQARKDSKCKTDKEFAELIGVDPSYYSNLKHWPRKGSKAIGDDCRLWEKKLGLPLGWFDSDGSQSAPPPPPRPQLTWGAMEMARIIDGMDQPDRLRFEHLLEDYLQTKRSKTG
jgi:hypothetical protein